MKKIIAIAFIVLSNLLSYAQNTENKLTYRIEYHDTNKTYLKIYFIDSLSGKDLNKEFKDFMPLIDSPRQSKKQIKKVKGQTENLLFNIKPAIYSFKILNRTLYNVDIQENKLNCVFVYLRGGTLQFAYYNETIAPAEFEARVQSVYGSSQVTIQKCDRKIDYPLGKYLFEVNTIPVYRGTIDIIDHGIYEIQIQRPAFLILKSVDKTSEIRLYSIGQHGWEQLENLDLNNVDSLRLKVQSQHPLKVTWKHDGRIMEQEMRLTAGQTLTVECN